MAFLPHHVVPDSPVNNFAVLNSINQITAGGGISLSSGNLNVDFLANANNASFAVSSIKLPESGLWYFEAIKTAGTYYGAGLHDGTMNNSYILPISWSETSSGIIGILADMDTNTIYSYINGSIVSSNTASIASDLRYFAIGVWSSSGNGRGGCCANFGQDHTFVGNKTGGGGYQDGAGLGQFYYDPPSVNGEKALALCTKNIPSGPIDVHQDDVPSDYMRCVDYPGTGVAQNINVGFTPDLVWIKCRDNSFDHMIYDSIRGVNNVIYSNGTSAEGVTPNISLNEFITTGNKGFQVVSDNGVNNSSYNYIAWCFRAAGSPADGGSSVAGSARIVEEDGTQADTTCAALASAAGASITPAKVSANRKSGFSIITYTSNPSGSASTLSHGLTQAPEMVIVKQLNNSNDWMVWHKDLSSNNNLNLNRADGQFDVGGGGIVDADQNHINLGTSLAVNSSWSSTAQNYVSYAWHSVAGFSKISSYVGNGSPDGPYVECGFRPSFLLLKHSTGANQHWWAFDSARDPDNPVVYSLLPNLSSSEGVSNTGMIDFLSNGFRIKTDSNVINGSNQTCVFMCFAEQPFNAPSNAR